MKDWFMIQLQEKKKKESRKQGVGLVSNLKMFADLDL